jgi:hypothetical protein
LADQEDVIVFKRPAKCRPGHSLHLALSPGRAPLRMIHRDRLRFRVVVRDMHENFSDARLRVLDQIPKRRHTSTHKSQSASMTHKILGRSLANK